MGGAGVLLPFAGANDGGLGLLKGTGVGGVNVPFKPDMLATPLPGRLKFSMTQLVAEGVARAVLCWTT